MFSIGLILPCKLTCLPAPETSNIFPPWRKSPQWVRASSLSKLHDHTQTHHTRYDSPGRVISATQRPLPDSTQKSQQTHPCPRRDSKLQSQQVSGCRPTPRPSGHWDRSFLYTVMLKSVLTLILRRSHTGAVWFYTSTSNKRAARPKLYTKSLTRDLKLMYEVC